MAQKYYNTEEVAKMLGLSEDVVKQMVDSNELHGYRDGPNLKFKAEDIDKLTGSGLNLLGDDGEDLLMVDADGPSSPSSKAGAVIGGGQEDDPLADSYVQLGESALQSDPGGTDAEPKKDDVDTTVSQFEELDLTLDEDLTLEDSSTGATDGQSTIDLSGSDLDDDDLVLGGSGGGSDISIGGDSGISLVDPIDSGLSLEEPLSLSSSGDGLESLELGEDIEISIGGAGEDAPTELKTDDDFLLTPLEDTGDDDSESGSQVIALDTDGDEGATMIADDDAGSMAAMLDEDLSDQQPGMEMGGIAGIEQPAGFVEGAPIGQPEAVLPEMPYSIWNVLGLAVCIIFLALSGMFMYDLLRNVWSWDAPFNINSNMMDTVLGWFEGEG